MREKSGHDDQLWPAESSKKQGEYQKSKGKDFPNGYKNSNRNKVEVALKTLCYKFL